MLRPLARKTNPIVGIVGAGLAPPAGSENQDPIVGIVGARSEATSPLHEGAEKYAGYRIPRLLYIGDRAFEHGGFYPDAQLRLFQNGKGSFIERQVHESVHVDGPIGRLKSPLLHYAYTDFSDYAATLDRYARLSAQEFAGRANASNHSWQTSKINEVLHPIWTFCYRYFLRGGFLDGLDGLKANWIYKDYVRKKITYLRQLKAKQR